MKSPSSRDMFVSIRHKLRRIVFLASGAALLSGCGLFLILGLLWYEGRAKRDLESSARLMAGAGATALEFDDAEVAQETLRLLHVNEDILAAGFYKDGKLLASYARAGSNEQPPAEPPPPGYQRSSREIVQRVVCDSGSNVGLVYLRQAPEAQQRFVIRSVLIFFVTMAAAMLAALPLARRLERQITRPILTLLATTRQVAAERTFAVRAIRTTDDEVGQLVDSFNEMLRQIEIRDRELAQHRGHLEDQVQSRTAELQQAISDLREAKERAEFAQQAADAANTAKSQFLANMSHELRTPLNAIIGYSEMLQEEADDLGTKELVPDLQKIHAAGRHLLSLINDILDLSKIEAGKMTLFLENFDLAQMVREVATTVHPLISRNGNQLEIECAPSVGEMRADITKVRQTLFNLLSNAAKFTERGVIRLLVQLESPPAGDASPVRVTFRVADTGIGMTPDQISRLFQAFSQADASTTRKFGGTGLGLVISKKFCQMMGGDLVVASSPGQGSTFTFTLPRYVSDLPNEAPAHSAPAASGKDMATAPDETRPMALVIDDDPAARDLLSRALSREQFRVETAAGGAEGIEVARRLRPAVITLDVMMPGMDGWAVLGRLKSEPATAEIPVVMVTVVDDRNLGFALGAAEYLTKPLNWDRFHAVMARYRQRSAEGRVLVVEDDPQTRELVCRALDQRGWKVASAENGRVGLDRLNEQLPELILLDLLMPEMDGFTFMRELRRRPGCRSLPVIVVTAKDLSDEDRRRLSGEVSQIIQKGTLSTDELVREIRQLLAATEPSEIAPNP